MTTELFDCIEFKPRPKKEGLHESGYRYINVIGVKIIKKGKIEKKKIAEWVDNITFSKDISNKTKREDYPYWNIAIDCAEDGTLRAFSRDAILLWDGWAGSDIRFFLVKKDYVK